MPSAYHERSRPRHRRHCVVSLISCRRRNERGLDRSHRLSLVQPTHVLQRWRRRYMSPRKLTLPPVSANGQLLSSRYGVCRGATLTAISWSDRLPAFIYGIDTGRMGSSYGTANSSHYVSIPDGAHLSLLRHISAYHSHRRQYNVWYCCASLRAGSSMSLG